jgi:hypothetical protein
VVDYCEVGNSAVYSRYNNGPKQLGKLKKFNDFFGSRTHDILFYNTVRQPTTLLHAPNCISVCIKSMYI